MDSAVSSFQNPLPLDVNTVGVRKPRSGSSRRPRSRSHSILALSQESNSSVSGDVGFMPDQLPEYRKSPGEFNDGIRMGDLDDKSLRIFQRRDKKKDDGRPFESRPTSMIWRDSEAVEKNLGRGANSPEYDRMKKLKEHSENPDRLWKHKDYSAGWRKEPSQKDKLEHHDRLPWKREKSVNVSRGDHPIKEKGIKVRLDGVSNEKTFSHREEQPLRSHKDWNNRQDYRGYGGFGRTPESKDSFHKSRNMHGVKKSPSDNGNAGVETIPGMQLGASPNSAGGSTFHHERLGDQPHNGTMPVRFSQGSNHKSKVSTFLHKSTKHEANGEKSHHISHLKFKVNGVGRSGGEEQSVKRPSVLKSESNKRRQRLILQEDSDEENDVPSKAKESVHPAEEDGFLTYLATEPGISRNPGWNSYGDNQSVQGVRKSTRVPKKRVFDDEEDIEVQPKKRRRKKVEVDSDEDLYKIEDDGALDLVDDEEIVDVVNECKPKMKRKQKSLEADMLGVVGKLDSSSWKSTSPIRTGVPLTARQRALQFSKEGLTDSGEGLVEFPEGLDHSTPKKPKDSLTAAERKLKKEEAAIKRREQVEKAAKEQQASAMQRVLNQDSQRKKREEKLQKQRKEIEQEKKAAAMTPATNSIRWTMGASGTVVSFSHDLELPNIFSGPLSYPQERERCAGPLCTNPYKYRDSKTLLPLCSLQCYKAVQNPGETALAH